MFNGGYIPLTITNYSIATNWWGKTPDILTIIASRMERITLFYYNMISITARGRGVSLMVFFCFTQAQACKHVSGVLFGSPVS